MRLKKLVDLKLLAGILSAGVLISALACSSAEEEPTAVPQAAAGQATATSVSVPTPAGFEPKPTPTTTTAIAQPTAVPPAEIIRAGKFGGTFEVAYTANPFTLDTMSDTISAVTHPVNQIMEQLFALDANLDPQPMLVESWEAQNDGATWIFNLREDVPFHNGQLMVANDVVASLDRWIYWDTVWGKRILDLLTSIEATDAHTVRIELTEPFAPMLAALSMSEARQAVIHPADIIAKYPYKDLAEGQEKPRIEDADIIGTGPYKFSEWLPDVKIVMDQHSDYAERSEPLSFHAGQKTPYFDRVNHNIVPEAAARLAGLLTERYDFAIAPGIDQFKTLQDDPNVEPYIMMSGRNESTFNATIPPFDDKRMRQAFAWTLDPKPILQALAPEGLYELNPSPFYKFQPTWWRDTGNDIYSQVDLEKAEALIREAGYEPPVEIKYIYNPPETSDGGRATLVVIQQLEDSGLWKVNAEENAWPIHVQVRWEKKHNVMYNGFNPFYQTDLLAPTWNDWEHPAGGFLKADRRIELMAERQHTTDPAEIARIADEFAEWWWDDVPLYSWGNFATIVGARKNVQNFSWNGNPVYFGLWFEEDPGVR